MVENYDNSQLADIARDYYLSKLPITQISQKYDLSRYLIAKALEEAEASGVVHISIKSTVKRNSQLENDLRTLFGLKEVFVLKDQDTTSHDNEQIVDFAAHQIQNYSKAAKQIGLTWGTTVLDTIVHFDEIKRPDLAFIQLAGMSLRTDTPHANYSLIQRAAEKFDAKSYILPAPLYILNQTAHDLMEQEPAIAEVQKKYQNLDLIFTGVGTLASMESNRVWGKQQNKIFAGIDQSQVAGMIFGRAYNIQGHIFESVEEKFSGIHRDAILKTPIRFAIVKNKFKTHSLLGALRTHLITHLVINEAIANKLLQEVKKYS
ncbi:sugar-binding transcriptional regulator [Lactobacillus mulieris]|uniref:Damage-inducible protein CinA n=1 Tax=Lactobacillus mulieris TaxID=2508708 RepID=A0AAW5WX17_9LACO|nr:sugar-binding domain-containing protein [Lactobacillus mulieris]MCZ3689366.1 damage-inducible protein CinA [Lactobacillus mulieris]MCZ3695369.1 damage-inducible protein CinA [Lactobacillus mulieris]MCZ3701483.1 damage-inducible protein CinA [Lactobacillus mulieris]MCZ3702979.1 damage-inducible protein CinA [Lactobacillus mulieris]MCZ3704603.1 damage-inducible protein CinA [Lactobacillus mulieris]